MFLCVVKDSYDFACVSEEMYSQCITLQRDANNPDGGTRKIEYQFAPPLAALFDNSNMKHCYCYELNR
jgi:hypothetical protein